MMLLITLHVYGNVFPCVVWQMVSVEVEEEEEEEEVVSVRWQVCGSMCFVVVTGVVTGVFLLQVVVVAGVEVATDDSTLPEDDPEVSTCGCFN